MNFESITVVDLKNIAHLQPEGWSDIIPEFEFYVRSPFCKAIMKKSGEKIIAVGASVKFRKTGWIAHIIVDKNFRRQGLGFTITEELVKDFENNSIESAVLIATELGRPVYEKLGFKTVSEYVFYQREQEKTNSKLSVVIQDYKEEYYDKIIKFDESITGEYREDVLKDKIKDAKLIIKGSKLNAYYIPTLGEGPIIAENKTAGIELMKHKYSTSNYAVLPVENKSGINFLKNIGFKKLDKKGTRMVRGNLINWKPELIFSRIGGNFG